MYAHHTQMHTCHIQPTPNVPHPIQSFNSKIVKKTKKKESMFATSDAGKVGVIGSGKGMTEFQTREKYVKSKISAPPTE